MVNPNRFYTYAYLREDRTPYYIGKGSFNRAYGNHKYVSRPKDKSRIIYLKQNLTEKEAFKHEIYMIAVFGRIDLGTGILHNRTDGGDGTSGHISWNKGKTGIHSEEALQRMKKTLSEKLSGENNPMYGKLGKDHPSYGYRHTEESKRKMSEANKGEKSFMHGKLGKDHPSYGYRHTEESKRKMSECQIGEKNHRYGKKSWNSGKSVMMWITNGIESKYVFKEVEMPEGWRKGRISSRKTKMLWITNGVENKLIPKTDEIPQGWSNGMTHSKKTNK